ncbi:heme/hemin ABC transporter substrate-binding protein [Aureibacter tunicatorum]|uniref:Iron complex transport system substrate-binding protein n=1 Tax=Aureibacter tunicatorum TaxID=866807 RepID=A0AAE4BS59_9BACT|nr:ABC transporter substrate-binding protein [Aureibacter tunicatorum]MDR6238017.1 iron complex transport system substrate-binding protein [Aureibacter tunicatorum]BDD03050.1 hypothetical protein AUTU_05330 [Aureibacter tunicatorum]
MRKLTYLITLLLAVFVAESCSEKKKENTTDVNQAQERIVSIGGQATEILFALGKGDQVVGRDVTSVYPLSVASIPSVGHSSSITAEGILALTPSVVVMPEGTLNEKVESQLSQAGVEVVKIGKTKSLSQLKASINTLGSRFNENDKSAELVGNVEKEIASVSKVEDSPKVMFIYSRGRGAMTVGGKGTFAEEIISLAGGKLAVENLEGFKPLTPEALIEADPDYVLFFDTGLQSVGGVEGALEIPGMKETSAGKNGKIISMDGSLLAGFGPRLGQAASELSKKINS